MGVVYTQDKQLLADAANSDYQERGVQGKAMKLSIHNH